MCLLCNNFAVLPKIEKFILFVSVIATYFRNNFIGEGCILKEFGLDAELTSICPIWSQRSSNTTTEVINTWIFVGKEVGGLVMESRLVGLLELMLCLRMELP